MSDWSIRLMIYGAGEAINGSNALAPQINAQLARLATVCTNTVVAATAQLDASDVPTLRYVLDPAGRQPVYQLPNVDVGDPNQLIDFVTWSNAICPAAHSVLVLSGHGAAWEDGQVEQVLGTAAIHRGLNSVPAVSGAIHHPRAVFGNKISPALSMTKAVLIDGHDRDFLSNSELGVACQRAAAVVGGKIDVLVFDACLMSALEVLQELRGSVGTVVASIDELSAAGIDMAEPARVFSSLAAVDAPTLAKTIVDRFTPQAAFDSCVAINLESDSWSAALTSFQTVCTALLPWIQSNPANADALRAALRLASTSVVQYATGGLADVGALASAIAGIPGAPAAAISGVQAFARSLRGTVLSHKAGIDYVAAVGLSIFAPNSATVYISNRPEYIRLQFAGVTGWGAVLDALYGFQGDAVRSVLNTALPLSLPPATPAADDAEFVVSLRGFPIDAATQDRLEKAVRRTVLAKLAEVDALDNVSVVPAAEFLETTGVRSVLGIGRPTLGLVIRPNFALDLHDAGPTTSIQPETPAALQGMPA